MCAHFNLQALCPCSTNADGAGVPFGFHSEFLRGSHDGLLFTNEVQKKVGL